MKIKQNKEASFFVLKELSSILWSVHCEIVSGIKDKKLPWLFCLGVMVIISYSIILEWDVWLFRQLHWLSFYPTHPILLRVYRFSVSFCGFFLWGLYQAVQKRKLIRLLKNVFETAKLKNGFGQYPSFIRDSPIDEGTRILKLGKRLLPAEKFRAARAHLESGLGIFIDEIKDDIEGGTISILYGQKRLATQVEYPADTETSRDSFLVGMSRVQWVRSNFNDTPHLLVAGLTGGGKSTFLRGLITKLYLANADYEFLLIDLKAGLEFRLFQNLPRVEVKGDFKRALSAITRINGILEDRMKLLAEANSKDLDEYRRRGRSEGKGKISFDRKIIVVDEVSEIFLSHAGAYVKEAQKAREVLNRIARMGRACGIHLVLGTQRPDARALDTGIKANLPGKLCFPMADTASSTVVLNSARAKDLPQIKGRAIWQAGLSMTEVQTPFMSVDTAETLLCSRREEPVNPIVPSQDTDDDNVKSRKEDHEKEECSPIS